MQLDPSLAVYAVPLAALLMLFARSNRQEEQRSTTTRAEAIAAGLDQPASLHPVIDPARCMGCGSCIAACPEGEIIGLIDRKAVLLEPSQCIGHGACKTACPVDAISLVFGTAERGVDIPRVGSDFETNVPGIYIAGELGGMGLIRNAIEQGRQALASVAKAKRKLAPGCLDVVIVGAGPAGFAASLAAMEAGLTYRTVEQDSLGGTVSHYPRGKLVMTQPATLPIVGRVKFRETTKEELLDFWQGVMDDTGVKVGFQERVRAIRALPDRMFEVETTAASYRAGAVLLAIGRRGTPRKLGVPGEDQTKVVYRLSDPAQYRGQHVLVVGGGDSAIEAAVTISEEPGTTVTLCYRGDVLNRTKLKNRKRIEECAESRRVRLLFKSNVKHIAAQSVTLQTSNGLETLKNDAVIVCAGGILPTGFLKSIGIAVETKHGHA